MERHEKEICKTRASQTRLTVVLTEKQKLALKLHAAHTGESASAFLRRMVDEHLAEQYN